MTEMGHLADRCIWVMAKGYYPDEGGMQTYAEGVARAYYDAGARVTVFTQTSVGPRRECADEIKLIDIGSGKSAVVALRLLRAMHRERRSSGMPWFVHGTTWRTSILPLLLSLPYITTFHGREFMYAKGLVLRMMRQVAGRARRYVAVSHYSAARLARRLGPQAPDALVAWNGPSLWLDGRPDAALAKLTPGEPVRILSLCRIEPRKNIIACVLACAAMRERGYPLRYVIAGRGPQLAAVRAEVEAHSLEDIVEVAGFVSAERAAELYTEADIFLHPQVAGDDGRDFEGFGIAIADAMLSGSAVIVGSEGGAKELVEDGVSGKVVDGRDQRAIEAALQTLLTDPSRREDIATAGRSRADALFAWKRHVALIINAIDHDGTSLGD